MFPILLTAIFGVQLSLSKKPFLKSSSGFSNEPQYDLTSAELGDIWGMDECAPPVDAGSPILTISGQLANVGLVGTGLTSFDCAALKLGLSVTHGQQVYYFTFDTSTGRLDLTHERDVATPQVNASLYSFPDTDVFSDIPFMFPQMIDHLAAEGSTLIATSRHRDAWLAHIVENTNKGGCSLRGAYGWVCGPGVGPPPDDWWAGVYDKHQAILREKNVTQIYLEDSDDVKARKFCSTVEHFGENVAQRCAQQFDGHSWPHLNAG
jgi:hypothetical protein